MENFVENFFCVQQPENQPLFWAPQTPKNQLSKPPAYKTSFRSGKAPAGYTGFKVSPVSVYPPSPTPSGRSCPFFAPASPRAPGITLTNLKTGHRQGKSPTKNPPWRPHWGKVALRGRLRPVDFQTPSDTKKTGHRPSWVSERKRGLFWQHVSSGLVLSGEEFPNSTLQSVQEPAPESPRPPPLAGE